MANQISEEKNSFQEDIDGLDALEDVGGDTYTVKPWDPKKIRITTKQFSLREVVDQISDGDIDLSPDYQRDYVWKPKQRTRLIESLLLGIPLPAFYFNQSDSGSYQVVDGVQRLSTIKLFMEDGHRLDEVDLEYLKDLKDNIFSDLEKSLIRRLRSTQIVVHVIEPQTPDEVKYDIFNRVNTLGSPLSAQEIRHAMSGSRSREFLKGLVEKSSFDKATEFNYFRLVDGKTVRDSKRMADRELAIRFCAFRLAKIEQYREHANLDAFLMDFTKRIDEQSREDWLNNTALKKLATDFNRAMVAATEILEDAAFRRWPLEAERRGPINRAVFEAQANALADYSLEALGKKKSRIVVQFRKAFDDSEYVKSVTVGTGSANRVSYRLARQRAILKDALT